MNYIIVPKKIHLQEIPSVHHGLISYGTRHNGNPRNLSVRSIYCTGIYYASDSHPHGKLNQYVCFLVVGMPNLRDAMKH